MDNNDLRVVIGRRQILREAKKGNVAEIRIATNAEQQYIHSLIDVAKQHEIKYFISGTMEEFSAYYGIDVPSGSIGVLK